MWDWLPYCICRKWTFSSWEARTLPKCKLGRWSTPLFVLENTEMCNWGESLCQNAIFTLYLHFCSPKKAKWSCIAPDVQKCRGFVVQIDQQIKNDRVNYKKGSKRIFRLTEKVLLEASMSWLLWPTAGPHTRQCQSWTCVIHVWDRIAAGLGPFRCQCAWRKKSNWESNINGILDCWDAEGNWLWGCVEQITLLSKKTAAQSNSSLFCWYRGSAFEDTHHLSLPPFLHAYLTWLLWIHLQLCTHCATKERKELSTGFLSLQCADFILKSICTVLQLCLVRESNFHGTTNNRNDCATACFQN